MYGCEASHAFRCQLLRPSAGIWGTGLGTKRDLLGKYFSKEAPLALETELAASIASQKQEQVAQGG